MSRFKRALLVLAAACSLLTPAMVLSGSAGAYDVYGQACSKGEGSGGASPCSTSKANPLPKALNGAITILTYVGSIAAVIFIMVGGIKYVTSGGDSNGTAAAKDTIIYAIVGLIIILVARSIIALAIGKIR